MKKNLLTLGLFGVLLSQPVMALDLIGHTKSKNPLNVVSEISGTVESVGIETGEQITLGTILATIKAQDFELKVNKQKAKLDLAQADLKIKKSLYGRYQELRKKNSLSQNELDISAADYDSATANVALANIELKEAQLDLESTQINSSINGYVVSRSVENGAWVNQGDLLYQIVNIDVLNVRLLASEFDLGELHVGQEVEVWSEANPQLKIRSIIKRIGVEIDPESFAYPIDVEIKNPEHIFKSGMSIHASTQVSDLTSSITQTDNQLVSQ
ncbi:MAG: efflux RND transporter periplasmic adaptor subunit [Photobacterium frigidiphilum]|uniref:efflux RND transporter periplasmic adaptor subunit n=1 Tax=Photobacterium frigidiphilum TaxID=264736 RepID=UPI00300270B8